MTTPAGWYDDGSGRQRWWDGQQWTEHFAPAAAVAPAGEASGQEAPVTGAAESSEPDASTETPAETVVAPPTQAFMPPYAATQSTAPYTAPGGYPGAGASYPVGETGAGSGAYSHNATYPQSAAAAQAPASKKPSVLGLVGMGLAVLGVILSFIPFLGVVAWIILPAGFIISIVSLFLKGAKWPGIVGLSVAVVGAIIAVIMSLIFVLAIGSQIDGIDVPDPIPSLEPSTDPDADADEDPFAEVTVEEGVMGEPVTVVQQSGTAELTVTSVTWGPTNGTDFEASNGGYLFFNVLWEGVEGDSNVNPLYFTVVDADGNEGVYDLFGEDNMIDAGEIGPGETLTGTVSFDIGESTTYDIIFHNELFQEVAVVTVEASTR